MMNKFSLRLIKDFGLSLNTKCKYHIVYDPQSWYMMGVYDDFEKALREGYHDTLEQYYEKKQRGVSYKGFETNLSVWELLEHLSNFIHELNYDEPEPIDETEKDFHDFVLSRIDKSLQAYPDYIRDMNSWHSI